MSNLPETIMGHLMLPMISLELGSKYTVILEYLNFVPEHNNLEADHHRPPNGAYGQN